MKYIYIYNCLFNMIGISFGSTPNTTAQIVFIISFVELLSKAVFSKCIAYYFDNIVKHHTKGDHQNMNIIIFTVALCVACGGIV